MSWQSCPSWPSYCAQITPLSPIILPFPIHPPEYVDAFACAFEPNCELVVEIEVAVPKPRVGPRRSFKLNH